MNRIVKRRQFHTLPYPTHLASQNEIRKLSLMSSDITKILMQQLLSWSQAGLTHLPKARYSRPWPGDDSSADHPATSPTSSSTPPASANEPTAWSIAAVDTSAASKEQAIGVAAKVREKIASTNTYTHSQTAPTAGGANQRLLGDWHDRSADGAIDARPYPASLRLDERQHELSQLAIRVAGCQRCAILSGCRTQTVFGVGNPQPRLVFFGEAPGAEEDLQGEPFVGAAGQLLNKIIQACQMRREDVYIMNTIKCRPPQNRNPNPDEMENCWEYAERQLEILQPEFICCLGKIAAQKLLKTDAAISRLRGRWFNYRGSRVMVTYHPAYLLRTPAAKKSTWDDMKMLLKEMGIEIPQT